MDLKKKVGPLPVWAWGAVSATAGIGAIIILRRRKAAAAAAAGNTTSSDGSTLGTPADATTAVGDSGQQSYYYGAVGPTTATPATTATQSQVLAATNLNRQVTALQNAEHELGRVDEAIALKTGGAAAQKSYAQQQAQAAALVSTINQQIQSSIAQIEIPSGSGTTASS